MNILYIHYRNLILNWCLNNSNNNNFNIEPNIEIIIILYITVLIMYSVYLLIESNEPFIPLSKFDIELVL